MSGKAVVTGASGGIGYELAKILARDGHELVLVARSADRLAEIAEELSSQYGTKVSCIQGDLTDPDICDKVFSEVGDTVDILVNNAGFGDYGPFAESDWSKQESMIELNVLALTKLTHLFLPGMISRGGGRILNVASIAGFAPGPLMSVYYASKAYVLSFTEAVSVETKGTGVTVTALCPGPVNTGFARAANAEEVSLFKDSSGADATAVAEFGYRKMMKGRTVAVHGALFKAATIAVRILPRGAVRGLVHRIQRTRVR